MNEPVYLGVGVGFLMLFCVSYMATLYILDSEQTKPQWAIVTGTLACVFCGVCFWALATWETLR